MIRLTLNFAGRSIGKYNFDQDVVCIGREPSCDVQIDNIGVSRRHASIEAHGGQYILKDLKSHNGIFVKGQKVESHRLAETDEFFIGKYSIAFESIDVTIQEPAPAVTDLLQGEGAQDMTFRLDKTEIDRLMGASALANAPKLSQVAPAGEKWTVQLEGSWFLIGKHPKSTIRLQGFLAPMCGAILIRSQKNFHLLALSRRLRLKVNGQRVFEKQLADGDVLGFGKRKFRYSLR